MQRRLFITGLICGIVGGSSAVFAATLFVIGSWPLALPSLFSATWAALMALRMLRSFRPVEVEVPPFVTKSRGSTYGEWFGDTGPAQVCGAALAAGVQEDMAARREDETLRRIFECSACSGTGVRHVASDPEVCFRCEGSGVALDVS